MQTTTYSYPKVRYFLLQHTHHHWITINGARVQAGSATVLGPMSSHCSDSKSVQGGIPASVPGGETHALTNSERRDKEWLTYF